jgi:hypothetical protein
MNAIEKQRLAEGNALEMRRWHRGVAQQIFADFCATITAAGNAGDQASIESQIKLRASSAVFAADSLLLALMQDRKLLPIDPPDPAA